MTIEEKVVHREIKNEWWYTIKGDNAFDGVLEGWESTSNAFMSNVKKRDVVVQAGGYCGIFPKKLSKLFNIVYTFEPTPINFHCLVKNCIEPNIIKFQAALGKEHQMIHVNEVPSNMGMNKVRSGGSIPMFMVDDLNLATCDLIQLDCEGYEILILEGARETIKKHKPVISVEDTNSAIEGFLSIFDYKKVNGWGRDTVYATE